MTGQRLISGIVLALALSGLAITALAQAQPVPVDPGAASSFMEKVLFKALDLGAVGVILVIWYFERKRATSAESIVQRYEESAKTHLEAFKEIAANYRQLATDQKDTMLLSIQVQTRLVEKLESMERNHAQ